MGCVSSFDVSWGGVVSFFFVGGCFVLFLGGAFGV